VTEPYLPAMTIHYQFEQRLQLHGISLRFWENFYAFFPQTFGEQQIHFDNWINHGLASIITSAGSIVVVISSFVVILN
jgi:hypothetical protein